MPSTIDGYATTNVDDLFNQYTLVQSKDAVDPLAFSLRRPDGSSPSIRLENPLTLCSADATTFALSEASAAHLLFAIPFLTPYGCQSRNSPNVFGVTGHSEPEYYDVDDTPLPEEDGVLRLKMPIARQPDVNLPLSAGVSVYMGYIPITEEEAFDSYYEFPSETANNSGREAHFVCGVQVFNKRSGRENPSGSCRENEHSLQASHFTIPRGQMSVDQIIDRIRKVVFVSDDIHEIAPKNTHSTQDRILYSSTLLYATFDQYGNHRFAQFNIRLQPIKDQDAESIAIVATHFQGDTRLSMEFFLTLRAYVLSNGNSECKVRNPELFHGFADQYIDDMSEPANNKC